MGESTVQEILERIDQLSHEERELLEERLAEREAAAWEQTVSEARRTARTKGLDEAAIDRAIDEVRYPK